MTLFLVLTIASSAYVWRDAIRNRSVLFYAQHRCANCTAPADRVSYEFDPVRASALLAGGSSYIRSGSSYVRTGGWTAPVIFQWPELAHWSQLRDACSGTPGWSSNPKVSPTLFIHELRHSSSGQRRLVCVSYSSFCSWWDQAKTSYISGEMFIMQRITPPGLVGRPIYFGEGIYVETQRRAAKPNTADTQFADRQNPQDVIQRFYAGQIDPADSGHFTIDYDTPAGRRTLDGRLAADGESVTLTIRP